MALYIDRFRERIVPGREPDPGELIAWFLEINPFRRPQDVEFILEGFRLVDAAQVAGYARPAGAVEPEEANANAFLPQGDNWIVAYGGRRTVLADMKGLHDLRRLLSAPGEEIHCLDLAERAAGSDSGDAVLDARARRAYQERIRDLQEELVEAEDMNDLGRAERVRAEMDRLIETLASALSLGGRSRRLGDLTGMEGQARFIAVTNVGNEEYPEILGLVDELYALEADDPQFVERVHRIEQLVAADVPVIPIAYLEARHVYNADRLGPISSDSFNPLFGVPDLRQMYVSP
jgi:hypothetical protein